MNRDLLEALAAVTADVYIDAIHHHPALFAITNVADVTDDDRLVFPVLMLIDDLLLALDIALDDPSERVITEPLVIRPGDDDQPDLEPDDIPF